METESLEDQKEERALRRGFHKSVPWSVKQLTGLISGLAALITSIAAFHKPPEEPVAETAYKLVAAAHAEDERRCLQNHDDIIALRSFLYEYMQSQGLDPDHPSLSRLAPIVSPVGGATPPPDQVVPPASELFSKHSPSVSRPKIGKVNTNKIPVLPDIGPPLLEPRPLPSFDTVKKSSADSH